MYEERGIGLVEVLVAMMLLAIALAVFGTAYGAIIRTSEKSQDVGAVTDQARLALNQLDRQVRFGFWVKDATSQVAGASSAVAVLTRDTTGARRCWIWAIDSANGRLMTYNFAPSNPGIPSLASFGSMGVKQWEIAAGPEDDAADPRRVKVGGTLSVSNSVGALDIATYSRKSYFLTVNAALQLTKAAFLGGIENSVPFYVTVSVRNQWIGAPYASECLS